MCKIFSFSFHRRHLTNYKLDQISLFNDMAKMLQQYKLSENVYLSKAYTSECWCPLARQDFLATCSGGTLRDEELCQLSALFIYQEPLLAMTLLSEPVDFPNLMSG